jgi:hypothetical protein
MKFKTNEETFIWVQIRAVCACSYFLVANISKID